MTVNGVTKFDPAVFLANAGLGRRIVHVKAKHAFFTQGGPADCVFYLQSGRAKLTVVSSRGKEATITLLTPGEFVGEETIAGAVGLRFTITCPAPEIVLAKRRMPPYIKRRFPPLAIKPLFTVQR